MQNSKRPLKKVHLTKGSIRRGLSLLLSLCMMTSLFGGVITFPALAQRPDQGSKQTALAAGTQKEPQQDTPAVASTESREAIKARLMRQARNGWDPYSATGMSMDEFYALMELFQEGSLPLDNSMAEIIDKDPDAEDSDAEEPGIEDPDAENPDAEDPDVEDPDAEDPDAENPDAEEPDAEDPGAEEPDAEDPDADEPSFDGPTIADEPGTEDQDPNESDDPTTTAATYIPREMFLFSGLNPEGTKGEVKMEDGTINPEGDISSKPGRDPKTGSEYGSPLNYDNVNGHDNLETGNPNYEADYPKGLDPTRVGYTRPPKGWKGLALGGTRQVTVVDPSTTNKTDRMVGDVDQGLFLEYDGVYVRRVTVQNSDVTILGAIQMRDGAWVYYYLTRETQSTQVSATILPDGKKFVVHYAPLEYKISYQIRFRATGDEFGSFDANGYGKLFGYDLVRDTSYGETYYDKFGGDDGYKKVYESKPENKGKEADIADWVRQLPRLVNVEDRAALAHVIFGADFPPITDEGRYSFTATAPQGYTLAFYMASRTDDSGTWINGSAQLVTAEGYTGGPGDYKAVNNGWALGVDPVYVHDGDKLMPDEAKGPQEVVTTGTFYNNSVDADRIVVAVLRKKPTPQFDAYSYFHEVGGKGGIDVNIGGRGSTAFPYVVTSDDQTVPYDYEDVYHWARGEDSDYTYTNPVRGTYMVDGVKQPPVNTVADMGNLKDGNIVANAWNWNDAPKALLQNTMTQEADGTYSYQWTFQVNGGEIYTLDTLEINRTGIAIPFHTKNVSDNSKGSSEYSEDDTGGRLSWWAETPLPDGALVRVECLMVFANSDQRVYRITVTGARNNITVTNMNLMQYRQGAPEIAVYELDGVTGATTQGSNTRKTAIQNFDVVRKGWGTADNNVYRGEVLVEESGKGGTDFINGDPDYGGANIRFKLASGYSNPAYLFENRQSQVINYGNELQHSITRNDDLSLNRNSQHPVVPWISDGSDTYMKYYKSSRDGAIPGDNGINEGEPIPVDKDGNLLYYKDGDAYKLFTEWTILRINADENAGGTTGGEVLAPALYKSSGSGYVSLNKTDVIADRGKPTFLGEDANTKLKPQYIYSGPDTTRDNKPNEEPARNWYYIRLTGHLGEDNNRIEKFALLTVVAFPTRYVVRYKPTEIPAYTAVGQETIPEHMPENMPDIQHQKFSCPTFLQTDPEEDESDDRDKGQFDDNNGDFFDIVDHTDVSINTTIPTDPRGKWKFVDWMLVDEYDEPVKLHYLDENGTWARNPDGSYATYEARFATSTAFSVLDYADYAIFNSDLGAIDDDIYVLRLVPTWEPVINDYHYTVALNWVDAQGNLHEEYFDDKEGLWQSVLTDFDQQEGLGPSVKIITEATPFQDWIAQHPTYTFWDAANNAVDGANYNKDDSWHNDKDAYKDKDQSTWSAEEVIRHALDEYFPVLDENASEKEKQTWQDNYVKALEAIMKMNRENSQEGDDFERLGNYTYQVREDYGTIVIWMFEDKGGLVFHKSVDAEPFTSDEEFYFTVNQVKKGVGRTDILDGKYKAYPETVYDERTGAVRTVNDSDAWLVLFKEGAIVSIVKNDGKTEPAEGIGNTYFTVRNGEGIKLYIPGGEYTITELGSRSGGSYRTEVTFVAAQNDPENNIWKGMEQVPREGWDLPKDYLWLKGSSKDIAADGKDQVSATVDFVEGEHNLAQIINFSNQTSVLAVENIVIGPYAGEAMGFELTLILPSGAAPLKSEDGSYAYFNYNLYDVTYSNVSEQAKYKDNAVKKPDLDSVSYAPPARGSNQYDEWLAKRELNQGGYADWLASDDYIEWLAWHNWRPEGATKISSTGRVVVTQVDGTNNWVAQYLMVEERNSLDVVTGWKRLDSSLEDGKIWLKNFQRFYMVSTVLNDPEQKISYTVNEAAFHTYSPDPKRDRRGTTDAAELAYELFINTKMAGLPSTGGMGDGVFRAAGLTFLTSGLGLVWLNRDLLERRKRKSVPAKEKGWGK